MRQSVVSMLALAILGGCVSVVRPPAAPDEPTTVFVAFEAMHKGLILPDENGTWTEWGFGEWDWYALDETAWYDAIPTVLWPTAGALGRRDLGRRSAAEVPERRSSARLVAIEVPNERVRRLRDRLREEWQAAEDTLHVNESYGMSFVRARRSYWFGHTCDDAAAEWLEALGCRVSWLPVRLGLTIEENGTP